nr:hypothetical protein [Brucella endophytica]
MKLIHRDQPVIENLNAEFIDGEAKRGMSADQNLVVAFQKRLRGIDLAAVCARRIAKVPFRGDMPIPIETVFRQRLVGEAGTDGFFRHNDNRLLAALVVELVQRDEHQRPALARCGRRFDQQVLFAPLLVHRLLHGPHAKLVRLG